jgi:hypothetical protein
MLSRPPPQLGFSMMPHGQAHGHIFLMEQDCLTTVFWFFESIEGQPVRSYFRSFLASSYGRPANS